MPYDVAPQNMTSDTAPWPYVASASSVYSASYLAFKAFNAAIGGSVDPWVGGSGASQWLQIYLGRRHGVTSYAIKSRLSNPEQAPVTFTLQGSNDGAAWVVVGQEIGQPTWAGGETRTFTVSSPGEYSYYRLSVTQTASTYCSLEELHLYDGSAEGTQHIGEDGITAPTAGLKKRFTGLETPTVLPPAVSAGPDQYVTLQNFLTEPLETTLAGVCAVNCRWSRIWGPNPTGIETFFDGDYTTHVFRSDTTFTPLSTMDVEVLVVGGGGGGGGYDGGGGGAGGVVYDANFGVSVAGGPYSIVVGAGAIRKTGSDVGQGADGEQSSFGSLTAGGGGGGGTESTRRGRDGASGGGGAVSCWNEATIGHGGVGVSGGGNDGGDAQNFVHGSSGGGGGAGAVGSNGVQYKGGAGGVGVQYSQFAGVAGSPAGWFGGGGGGCSGDTQAGGDGGSGGGGVGGHHHNEENAVDGTDGTGGGGGGGYYPTFGAHGAGGGDGIVIVRYAGVPQQEYGVTFTDATSPTTGVQFDVVGAYRLRLTADDGVNTKYSEVVINAVISDSVVAQVAVEVANAASATVGDYQVVVEALHASSSTVLESQLLVEALLAATVATQELDQLVVEVLMAHVPEGGETSMVWVGDGGGAVWIE